MQLKTTVAQMTNTLTLVVGDGYPALSSVHQDGRKTPVSTFAIGNAKVCLQYTFIIPDSASTNGTACAKL